MIDGWYAEGIQKFGQNIMDKQFLVNLLQAIERTDSVQNMNRIGCAIVTRSADSAVRAIGRLFQYCMDAREGQAVAAVGLSRLQGTENPYPGLSLAGRFDESDVADTARWDGSEIVTDAELQAIVNDCWNPKKKPGTMTADDFFATALDAKSGLAVQDPVRGGLPAYLGVKQAATAESIGEVRRPDNGELTPRQKQAYARKASATRFKGDRSDAGDPWAFSRHDWRRATNAAMWAGRTG